MHHYAFVYLPDAHVSELNNNLTDPSNRNVQCHFPNALLSVPCSAVLIVNIDFTIRYSTAIFFPASRKKEAHSERRVVRSGNSLYYNPKSSTGKKKKKNIIPQSGR